MANPIPNEEKLYERNGSEGKKVLPESRIVVQEAVLRGRKGFTLDVFYPEDHVDKLIAGETEEMKHYSVDWNIGLENWMKAYQHGDLSGIKDIQSLSNLGINVDELVPTRTPTPAERYEIHQRWAHQGGEFIPGVRTAPTPEDYYKSESTVRRSQFEEDAFAINSSLTIVLNLYRRLKDLVKDDFVT